MTQQVMNAARAVANDQGVRAAVGQALGLGGDEGPRTGGGFGLDPSDFPGARPEGNAAGTRIAAVTCAIDEAAEVLSRSHYEAGPTGPVHVITPMVMPRSRRLRGLLPVILAVVVGVVGWVTLAWVDDGAVARAVVGPHYWALVVLLAGYRYWRQGMVMVPEGCRALISRFGKVEAEVGPGLVTLLNPWKRVSYIINTTREYPYNAPIRHAPTKSGVQASVDLFLQFKITNAREFVFVLGAVQGFQDKLNNAISETTRSLIYEQEAAGIYDLVGESTGRLLEQLNSQFQPAVQLTTANITHAEPASQEYRMDLAAPEMVRVAKEAYTYEYELNLRKEQNEGDLNKDLASLNETLSAIQADIARYQAQMDTALERETNRAEALARQRFVESESTARANAALLEAQALDIRATSAALAPEILEYTYQQDVLDKLESLAGSLPQMVRVGGDGEGVDFLAVARELVGGADGQLFSEEDMAAITARREEIAARVAERESRIEHLLEPPEETQVEIVTPRESDDVPGADRVEELRRSVAVDTPPAVEVARGAEDQEVDRG
ncbi:SPFH domain-containing protein [Actinotalea caeni]|uniref:SPFH domain-containing protein n=1 Tax=Actinotalea caeni TaxID=1348467 RepID=UPI001F036114|nr:SPFH domain-containing protein [Actinotalea caeni]